MTGKKILVTGGTGFIGSHTVVELIHSGYQPLIIDDFSNSIPAIIDQIEKVTGIRPDFYQLDLCNEEALTKFCKANTDIEGIIHFAAFKSVGESVEEPLKYYRNNIYSLCNLLQNFSGRTIDFVFSSSCTVYGEPDALPVDEHSEVKQAESPYGNTKQIAEEILRDYSRVQNDQNIISLRYFNPVGAHSSGLLGELPVGVPQNLVPFITQSAIGKRPAIVVFGDDYDTPDGSCVRDYIHVVDLAKAHIAALKKMERQPARGSYDVYNVGTGRGYSVLEVIHAFESSTGVKLNYTIGPRRSGDVEMIYGKVSKAETELGWKARLDLAEMMRSAWAWENYIFKNPL